MQLPGRGWILHSIPVGGSTTNFSKNVLLRGNTGSRRRCEECRRGSSRWKRRIHFWRTYTLKCSRWSTIPSGVTSPLSPRQRREDARSANSGSKAHPGIGRSTTTSPGSRSTANRARSRSRRSEHFHSPCIDRIPGRWRASWSPVQGIDGMWSFWRHRRSPNRRERDDPSGSMSVWTRLPLIATGQWSRTLGSMSTRWRRSRRCSRALLGKSGSRRTGKRQKVNWRRSMIISRTRREISCTNSPASMLTPMQRSALKTWISSISKRRVNLAGFAGVFTTRHGDDSILTSRTRLKVLVRTSFKSIPATRHRCARTAEASWRKVSPRESTNAHTVGLLPIEITMLRWISTAWGWNSPLSLWRCRAFPSQGNLRFPVLWRRCLYITSLWCKCWPW